MVAILFLIFKWFIFAIAVFAFFFIKTVVEGVRDGVFDNDDAIARKHLERERK